MSGLLGFMAAGAAQGFAEGRSKEIAAQRDFDLKSALLEAQTEKQMLLQERGIKMQEDSDQRKRDKVTGLLSTVQDPMAGKGGYETPEASEKRTVEMARQKANVLRESGYIEEAKSFDSVVDQYNKGELSKIKFENEITKINNALQLGKERNANAIEISKANNATQLARIEGAQNKKTDTQSKRELFMEAYADNKEYVKNGKLTAKGYEKLNQAKGDDSGMQEVTEKTSTDELGNPVTEKSVKRKEPISAPKVGKYVPGKGLVY